MLILWGWRSKVMPGKMLTNHNCESCGQGTVRAHSVVSYAHIFWIPLFPFRKQVATECSHCQHVAVGKHVSDAAKQAIKRSGATPGMPKWTFVGSIASLVLIGFFSFTGWATDSMTEEYVQTPLAGDYYVVEFNMDLIGEEVQWGLMLVTDVNSDSVVFVVGSTAYEWAGDADDAVYDGDVYEEDYFTAGVMTLGRGDLVDMWERDAIDYIIRDE